MFKIARLVHSGCWSGKVILCVSRAAQSPQGEGSKGTFPAGFGSLNFSRG